MESMDAKQVVEKYTKLDHNMSERLINDYYSNLSDQLSFVILTMAQNGSSKEEIVSYLRNEVEKYRNSNLNLGFLTEEVMSNAADMAIKQSRHPEQPIFEKGHNLFFVGKNGSKYYTQEALETANEHHFEHYSRR